ncbi:MAG: HEPN domain-containing protein, partial [Pseudolabrys sp.]
GILCRSKSAKVVLVKTDMPFAVFSHEADIDYLLARMVNFLGAGFHARAGFFAQQACEKYMKALIVQHSGQYPETHNLIELAGQCETVDAYFAQEDTNRILQQFDMFDQVGRYGGAANFDPLAKGKTVGGSKVQALGARVVGVAIWKESYIGDLDAFVFKDRSLLDFKKIGFDDSLKSILERNRRNILMGTWNGKPPLRVVLTKKNNYFRK